MKALIGGAILAIGLLIFIIGGTTHVSVGSIGVAKHMDGKITEVSQGVHWKGWGVSVQDYPTYRQALGGKDGVTFNVGTSDQQELPVTANLNWNINIKELSKLYQSIGGNDVDYVSNTIILPTVKNDINKVTHTYNWNAIKGNQQAEITNKIEGVIRTDLAKSGIEVVNFGFSHVGSPAGLAQAQSNLATSELNIKRAQQAQDRAKIENQTKILNAEAEAKANKIIEGSLNNNLLQQQALKKWNGTLPQVTSGATPFVNISK